jgi:NAD(P)-dependent dehydrogenase (short-subunit alcohol dehydrogenase family)
VAAQVRALGRREFVAVGDVSKEEDVRTAVEDGSAHFGRLDVALANAGYGFEKRVLDTTNDEHQAIFQTNYFGTVYTLQHAAKAMRATQDRTGDCLRHLMVTSSSASEIAPPFYGPYAATKAAQDSLCQAARAELADDGFHVTSIHPIGTETEFFEEAAKSNGGKSVMNTPDMFMQTAEHVAKRIMEAIEHPVAEVWPSRMTRPMLAAATAFPSITAFALKKFYQRQTR